MRKVYHIVTSPRLRRCYTCLKVKPLGDFRKCRSCKSGYKGQCKQCYADRNRDVPVIAQAFLFPFKTCTKCHMEKLLEEFGVNNASPDGYLPRCKQCNGQTPRKLFPFVRPGYRYCPTCEQARPIDQFSRTKGRMRLACNQCQNKDRRQWYYAHPERVRQHIQNRQSNPQYIEYHRRKEQMRYGAIPAVATYKKAQSLAWAKAHPLKVRERGRRHDAKKRATRIGAVSYARILERDGHVCYICGKVIDPTLKKPHPASLAFDHRVPLQPRPGEPQGTHTEDNISPVHCCCNSRKSNRCFEDMTSWERRGPE